MTFRAGRCGCHCTSPFPARAARGDFGIARELGALGVHPSFEILDEGRDLFCAHDEAP
jgi:hypothetical protein